MDLPILVVFAYHYPPDSVVGAFRPARFVKYLRRLGYRCLVITAAKQGENGPPDVIYVPDEFVTSAGRGLNWNLDRVVRKIFLPGAGGASWSLQAARAARKTLSGIPATQTTIFSTFPPLGSHLAAWQLARQTGFPWIADFRDPMVPPGLDKLIGPFQFRCEQLLEQRVFNATNLIVANTDSAATSWSQRKLAQSSKIHVIWNGFDPEKRIDALSIPERGYRLLSHAGELYNGRTVAPLLESIDRLVSSDRLAPSQLRVSLVGPAGKGSLPSPEVIARGKQLGWLELNTGLIPLAEARELTQQSDALLLVQPHTNLQVPGKLFEYLQIGRPIMALVLPDSPIERILKQSGVPYRCIYAGVPKEAFDESVLSFFSLPFGAIRANSWFEDNFSADRQTQVLHRLVQSLHAMKA